MWDAFSIQLFCINVSTFLMYEFDYMSQLISHNMMQWRFFMFLVDAGSKNWDTCTSCCGQIRLWQQRAHKVHDGLGRTSGEVSQSSNHWMSVLSRELWTAGSTSSWVPWNIENRCETTRTSGSCLPRVSHHTDCRQMLQVSYWCTSLPLAHFGLLFSTRNPKNAKNVTYEIICFAKYSFTDLLSFFLDLFSF